MDVTKDVEMSNGDKELRGKSTSAKSQHAHATSKSSFTADRPRSLGPQEHRPNKSPPLPDPIGGAATSAQPRTQPQTQTFLWDNRRMKTHAASNMQESDAP
ncbi:hypothetical protein CPB84DRAFT_214694 [Gymnopilus junonius]|uniref:Uncharacterized protein n=1 Tax=Gymnopilus junonius TaxID=109634 RepID=A0A9P5TJ78_GYMJU|nr:hypothetical protein CPB84DRAFT_214694 [Gymnopilus junonius]